VRCYSEEIEKSIEEVLEIDIPGNFEVLSSNRTPWYTLSKTKFEHHKIVFQQKEFDDVLSLVDQPTWRRAWGEEAIVYDETAAHPYTMIMISFADRSLVYWFYLDALESR